MNYILDTLTNLDAKNELISFLDRFDSELFKPGTNHIEFVQTQSPQGLVSLLSEYFFADKTMDNNELFKKSNALRKEIEGLPVLTLTTSSPLSDESKQQHLSAIKNLVGKPLLVELVHDEKLIGGAMLELDGRIVEYSFRAYFEHLSERRAHGL